MTATLVSPCHERAHVGHCDLRHPATPRAAASRGPRATRRLASYLDTSGRSREIVTRPGHAGSLLVIDRDLATRGHLRLVAHLAADEPAGKALVVCHDFLHPARAGSRGCRAVTAADARRDPLERLDSRSLARSACDCTPRDACGREYVLAPVFGRMSIPALRWRCRSHSDPAGPTGGVSLREVVARVESYDPACPTTEAALAQYRDDADVSTTVLEAELQRVRDSPIVLNRRLRVAVLRAVGDGGLSMSEIAMRCGRVKRDRRGRESGETSWLARRVGLLAEGGQVASTPWIHSDVLALIARRGLGLSPREVELS